MPFADDLSRAFVESLLDIQGTVNDLSLGETPFVNGILSASGGGTGTDNGAGALTFTSGTLNLNTHTLTLSADTTLSGSPAPATAKYIVQQADAGLSAEQALGSLATGILKNTTSSGVLSIAVAGTDYAAVIHQHDGGDITTGTIAAVRLGASPTATKLLFGDNTWAVLAATDIPSLDASKITTGTLAAARLGASPSATKLLFGDNTWSVLAATDIPNLDAAKTTTGTFATARLGSGTADNGAFLRGDGTWANGLSGGFNLGSAGGASAGQLATSGVAALNGASLSASIGLVVKGTGTTNTTAALSATNSAGAINFQALNDGSIRTRKGNRWDIGGYVAGGTLTALGLTTVTIDGVTHQFLSR